MIDITELAKLYPDFFFSEYKDPELGSKVIRGQLGLYEFLIANNKNATMKNQGKRIEQRVKDVRKLVKGQKK